MTGKPVGTIADYELVDRFAVGGAAEIFRAYDTRSRDLVVLKRLRPDKEFDPDVVAGFLREADLSLRMKHKNLIRGFARGTHAGLEYVVLEFVDGQDLDNVMRRAVERKIRIPSDFSLFIMREILDGLHFAHQLTTDDGRTMGLVHRDLNPRNIFVSYDGNIRVADFGIAVMTNLEPQPTDVAGSPGYLAPEQASSAPLDRRADVFAAGCMLQEMLTGARAFELDGKKDQVVLKMHQKAQLKALPATMAPEFRAIILKATAKEPAARYQTAAAMRDDVDAYLTARSSMTSPVSIAALVRNLFKAEFAATRLPGSPLTF